MASFIETQRGGKKLLLEGFAYVHHKKLASGGNSWLCDQRNSMKCPGSIKTDSNGNPTTAVQHSHAASPTRLEVPAEITRLLYNGQSKNTKNVLYIGDHRSKKSKGWLTFLVVLELNHERAV
ncbi:hypothetical protein niasHT_015137 [Heterodera trifolii]|uniref:FLYWCH-type domain-containing protein n=1 Tax=Heterodera trifolii TaxID=157864 RepID=A0ABD2LBZ6_9BILA